MGLNFFKEIARMSLELLGLLLELPLLHVLIWGREATPVTT